MAANVYRTVQDDSFDAIAYRLWGDEHLAGKLIAANPDHADVLLFGPGVELVVPRVQRIASSSANLPPWYAGADNA